MTSDATSAKPAPTLSVVVPTYREVRQRARAVRAVKAALDGLPWEMIVVDDDSPDGTSDVAFAIAGRRPAHALPQARQPQRPRRRGDRGLDGLQRRLCRGDRRRPAARRDDPAEDVRAARSGRRQSRDRHARRATATEGGLSPARQKLSDLGRWFFNRIAGVPVSDPMSGFFMIRRDIVARLAPRLSPDGFKILVDVVLSAAGELRVVEVPYVFRARAAGESKLSPLVGLDFLGLVVHHASGGAAAGPLRAVRADRPRRPRRAHPASCRSIRAWSGRRISRTASSSPRSSRWAAISCSTTRSPTATHRYRGARHGRRLPRLRARLRRRRARQRQCRVAAVQFEPDAGGFPASPARCSASCGTTPSAPTSSGAREGAADAAGGSAPAMIADALDAFSEIFSPPFRRVMGKSLGLTAAILIAGRRGARPFRACLTSMSGRLARRRPLDGRRARPDRRHDLSRAADRLAGGGLLSRRDRRDRRARGRSPWASRAAAPLGPSLTLGAALRRPFDRRQPRRAGADPLHRDRARLVFRPQRLPARPGVFRACGNAAHARRRGAGPVRGSGSRCSPPARSSRRWSPSRSSTC